MPESHDRPCFKAGDIVRHFKHELYPADSPMYTYRILGLAVHSETRETLVIYEALYDLKEGDIPENIVTEHEKMFSERGIPICRLEARKGEKV